MKFIEAISMYGGMNHAIHVQFERHAKVIDHYYFITSEGISTHRREKHMYDCLTKSGFSGFLDIKSRAVPLANKLLEQLELPEYLHSYLTKHRDSWVNKTT